MDKTSACPECGCVEYINKDLCGEGYRECKKCRQDWWVDIDYNITRCKWHQDGFHMEEHDYWETGCDNIFQFADGGPKQNHFEFCPYCGKPIEEVTE